MGREVKTQEGINTKSLGVFVQCNPLAPESTLVKPPANSYIESSRIF